MALTTRPAKAHILIGLAPSEIQIFQGNPELGLSHIHEQLSKELKGFHLHFYTSHQNNTEVHPFNAFLNFEVATYQNNQVAYPYLDEKVKLFVNRYFDSFKPEELQQYKPSKLLSTQFKPSDCESILYWLKVINRINKKITNSTACRLNLNLSNKAELILKNHKNDALLISSLDTTETLILEAIQLVLKVQEAGHEAGVSSIAETTEVKINSYGAVDLRHINDNVFYEDKLMAQYIEKSTDTLKQLDLNNYLENHKATILENFIFSFKNGAMSKLNQINLRIDF